MVARRGPATVRCGDSCHDSQTEAGAPVGASTRVVRSAEALEGMWNELRREAGPVVPYRDLQNRGRIALARAQPHLAAAPAVPQGIVEQVVDPLTKPVRVDQRGQLRRAVNLDADRPVGGARV